VNLSLSLMSLYPTKLTLIVSPLFSVLTWSIICFRVSLLRSIQELIELVQSKRRQRSSCYALSSWACFCLIALVLADVVSLGATVFFAAVVCLILGVTFALAIVFAGALGVLVAVDLDALTILLLFVSDLLLID